MVIGPKLISIAVGVLEGANQLCCPQGFTITGCKDGDTMSRT